jgi:hypothetical protein
MTTRTLLAAAALLLPLGLAACGPQPGAPAAQATAGQKAAMAQPAVDMAAAKGMLTPDATLQVLDLGASGTQTVKGRVVGDKGPAYAVALAAGQTLHVTFSSPVNAAFFSVHDASAPQPALFSGETQGRTATVKASKAGTYVIWPYLMRSVARRGTPADFTMTVSRK